MRKLLKYISAPYRYQQRWIEGGAQGALFIDAILGFEALEPCDEGARTQIRLITGQFVQAMGSKDEWIQKTTEVLEEGNDSDRIEKMVLEIVEANK